MTFREIGRRTGIHPKTVEYVFYNALTKLKRECIRRGIDVADIIGRPQSMLAQAQILAEGSE
jgi:hypothetical protein